MQAALKCLTDFCVHVLCMCVWERERESERAISYIFLNFKVILWLFLPPAAGGNLPSAWAEINLKCRKVFPPWTYHTALLSAVKASGVRVGKGQIQSIGFNKVFFNQGAISTTPKSSYKHFEYIFLFVFSNSSPKFVTYFYCLVQLFTTNTFNSNYYYFILLMVITIPHSRRKFIILRCL